LTYSPFKETAFLFVFNTTCAQDEADIQKLLENSTILFFHKLSFRREIYIFGQNSLKNSRTKALIMKNGTVFE